MPCHSVVTLIRKVLAAGAIAASCLSIPEYIIKECQKRLSDDLLKVVIRFEDYLDNEWQNKISFAYSKACNPSETVDFPRNM